MRDASRLRIRCEKSAGTATRSMNTGAWTLVRARSYLEPGSRARRPALYRRVAEKTLEPLDLSSGNGLAKPRHLVDASALVVVRRRLDLLDKSVGEHPLDRAVQRSGAHLDGAVA